MSISFMWTYIVFQYMTLITAADFQNKSFMKADCSNEIKVLEVKFTEHWVSRSIVKVGFDH